MNATLKTIVKTTELSFVLGILLALPLIYLLDLDSLGAITLLILICVLLCDVAISVVTFCVRKGKENPE